jgi:coniferyl-aldehyde dehydrogenase
MTNPPVFNADQSTLQDVLALQRAAYFKQPFPSLQERQADLATLERFIQDNKQAIVQAIAQDFGHRAPQETLMLEVAPVLDAIRHARRHLKQWMRPQRRSAAWLKYGWVRNRVVPQPLGVIGVIVPWNFPLGMSLVPLVSIFAAGNRAMIKLSENSRHFAALMIQRMPDYFARDKLQFFDEIGGVGEAFSALKFDHLLFTGSSTTGRAVMAAAAKNLCPVTLEMGGKSPALVCDDFDVALAAQRILFVKLLNAGQICTSVDHVYVPHTQLSKFVQLAQNIASSSYANLDSPDYTSIIDRRAFDRLCAALDEAKAGGAQVIALLPGTAVDASACRIAPHLVINAPANCQLMQREIFGPILPVMGYTTLDEVVAQINAGPRPLAFYPFTHKQRVLDYLLTHVMSGGVTVNDALLHVGQDDLPFGGVGESGMGHYHGRDGFVTFSKLRPVSYQAAWPGFKFLKPPYRRLANAIAALATR